MNVHMDWNNCVRNTKISIRNRQIDMNPKVSGAI